MLVACAQRSKPVYLQPSHYPQPLFHLLKFANPIQVLIMYSNNRACCGGNTGIYLRARIGESISVFYIQRRAMQYYYLIELSKVALPQDTRKIIDLLWLECL